jgi:hypothetical protein
MLLEMIGQGSDAISVYRLEMSSAAGANRKESRS